MASSATSTATTSPDHEERPVPAAPPDTAPDTVAVADPGALGLAAFAMTTFVLSCFNAGLFPASQEAVVLPLALFYGGLTQLAAGMWEFRRSNTFAATAFGSYGAFWLSFAAYVKFVVPGLGGSAAAAAPTGLFLLAWTIFTAIMLIAALRTNGAIMAVFVLLVITFLLLTVGELGGVKAIATAGGYAGILTAIAAWYAAAAVVVNATWGRTVLPVAPRG